MNIYELNKEIFQALSDLDVDEETGELTGMDSVDELVKKKKDKLFVLGQYVKELEIYEKGLSHHLNIVRKRKDSLVKKKKNIMKMISDNLDYDDKLENGYVTLSYRRSMACEIDDMDALPADCQNYEVKADKTRITKLLKEGTPVSGAHLVTNYNLQIK